MDVGGEPCDLRVIGVTKRYDGFTLDAVSLDVPRGSVVGLIGQNGAGKTTLMKAILGTIHTDAGMVELLGRDTASLTDAETITMRSNVGFVSA
ncbi:MAG: ATP-binding cassette domain-containing protein, partial [Atopobiaceae bacterium]|nr:ATP-binding cassette domain-containing protein [Atopobiaceae bacterium]